MFRNVLIAELLKTRRSLIPWLVLAGGFFPALVALLFVVTGGAPDTWETIAAYGLEFFNMLALLLVAVVAGNAFVLEYSDDGTNRMHAYPVPRLFQYLVKLLVVWLLVLLMHLVFLAFLFALGAPFAADALTPVFAMGRIRLTLLVAAGNLMLAPLAALAGILFRKAGAYILAGIGCFVVWMSFAGSDCARYALPCVPGEILRQCLAGAEPLPAETAGMLLFSAAVSALLLCAGAVCYIRMER